MLSWEADAVGDPDAKMWLKEARRYGRLRRRYWRCFLGMPALLVVLGAPTFAFEDKLNPIVRGILLSVFGVGWCACWVGCLTSWFGLIRFRCPRCGKRFVLSRSSSWLTAQCKHCELDLGSIAAAKNDATLEL